MTDDLRRSGSTPEDSTSGADVIARAKAAQSVWNRSHTVEIDIVYGPNAVVDAYYAAPEIVDGLLAEVERLRGSTRCRGCATDDRLRRRTESAEAEVERLRGALDGLAARWTDELAEDNTNGYGAGVERCLDELRDVLRGDQ